MKIKVDLGNIKSAIAEVEKYRDAIEGKRKRFLERLAEIGVEEAEAGFTSKETKYAGTNDVKVDAPQWVDENTICVRASGESILFIEFGAGVHFNRGQSIERPDGILGIGEYGKHLGRNEYWFFYGDDLGTTGEIPENKKLEEKGLIFTHGNPANRCMWEASKKIREEILNIAKEVFSVD